MMTPLLTEPAGAGRVGSLSQHLRRHLPQFMTWFVYLLQGESQLFH